MKRILVLALLSVAASTAFAQAATVAAEATPVESTATEENPLIQISRNAKDMKNTDGMDASTVITWVDRKGVRWYTDNPKLAPANAKTRQVYSMPAARGSAEPLFEPGDVQEQADSAARDQ